MYIDTALSFGLWSAPKIFSAVEDALALALLCNGVWGQLHYLNDFLFVGRPEVADCAQSLQVALNTCQELGMPVAMKKVEGPATKLTFLGIQIDSVTFELSLPNEKLARTKQLVMYWQVKQAATKQQLLSLIGSLSHAASVVVPGRTFLQCLIDTAKMAYKLQHFVRISVLWCDQTYSGGPVFSTGGMVARSSPQRR